MNRKVLLAATFMSLLATAATANCIGTENFYTCYDNSGNNYTVNKFGGMTTMTGRNTRTGTTWNQTTNRIGSNSFTNGRASNGNSWNMTTTPYGSYGRDSSGRTFNQFNYGN